MEPLAIEDDRSDRTDWADPPKWNWWTLLLPLQRPYPALLEQSYQKVGMTHVDVDRS